MVMPACSSTALIWSSMILISSVISAGALPDLSKPMRPARYSVLPARTPSLNGNCGLASGRWIARRLDGAGAWENAPPTVSNPAAASARNAKTALRFNMDLALLCMVSLHHFAVLSGDSIEIRARVYSVPRRDARELRGRSCCPYGRLRGYGACRCRRLLLRLFRRRGMRNLVHNFLGPGFAHRAIAVVDAALREGELAPASAALRVGLVQGGLLLLRSKLGKIDAGKLAGPIRMRQEDLAGVFKGFDARANGQSEQGADFCFVQGRVAQAFVLLHYAALGIQHKRSGQRGHAAILRAHFRRGQSNGIVDARSRYNLFDEGHVVVIHG